MDSAHAQKKKLSFKDSLDKKFDMSDYIIDLHGFIPVPILITEPALGGFGGGIAPVFIRKNAPYIDTVNGQVKVTPVSPNITGGVGLYTVNGTWFTALFKGGTLVKSRIKYRMGIAYANVNIAYYRDIPNIGETKFEVNIRTFDRIDERDVSLNNFRRRNSSAHRRWSHLRQSTWRLQTWRLRGTRPSRRQC